MQYVLDGPTAPANGLGDSLLFSTLPEAFSKLGHTVLINPATSARNREVYKLLYQENPYIASMWDGKTTCPHIGTIRSHSFFLAARRFTSPIECIESLNGLPFTNGRSTHPKIYYQPHFLPEWKDRVVVEPSSISQGFPPHVFELFVKRLFFDGDMFVLTSRNGGGSTYGSMTNRRHYVAENIYEYIDIMYSCQYFVCTESGASSLAAAVRKGKTFALTTTMNYNSRFFIWPNVIYTTTGQLSSDYLANDLDALGIAADNE